MWFLTDLPQEPFGVRSRTAVRAPCEDRADLRSDKDDQGSPDIDPPRNRLEGCRIAEWYRMRKPSRFSGSRQGRDALGSVINAAVLRPAMGAYILIESCSAAARPSLIRNSRAPAKVVRSLAWRCTKRSRS